MGLLALCFLFPSSSPCPHDWSLEEMGYLEKNKWTTDFLIKVRKKEIKKRWKSPHSSPVWLFSELVEINSVYEDLLMSVLQSEILTWKGFSACLNAYELLCVLQQECPQCVG